MTIMRRLIGVALGALVSYGVRGFLQRRVEDFRYRFQDLPQENYGNVDDLDVFRRKEDEVQEEE